MSLVLERNPAVPASAAPWSRESIANFVRGASIEISTRLLAEIDGYASLLAPATDVYATCLPGTPWRHIVGVARRLRRIGMIPVQHIAVRRLASAAVAAEFLACLRDEASVTRALIVAGDNRIAVGPYASSLAVLETGLLQAHGIRSIGFALEESRGVCA